AGEPSRQSSGAAVDRAAPAAAVPSPAVAKASDAVPAVAPLAP
ncbi:MAG TPA: cysteine dioxygenase, partial [Candidatus Accumulibacter sp.]|nr:cysteine dioxygenase [Accumulibacter sp.]